MQLAAFFFALTCGTTADALRFALVKCRIISAISLLAVLAQSYCLVSICGACPAVTSHHNHELMQAGNSGSMAAMPMPADHHQHKSVSSSPGAYVRTALLPGESKCGTVGPCSGALASGPSKRALAGSPQLLALALAPTVNEPIARFSVQRLQADPHLRRSSPITASLILRI